VRKSTIYLFVLGVAVVVMTALASAGLVVSAQNTNSSTTMAPTNTAAKKSTRRRGRGRKAKPAADAADASTTADTSMAAMPAPQKNSGRCDPTQQEQTDLSGTYTGKIKHGSEAPMDATLTISGNNISMTSGSDTHTGRITAVTTCGYTAATVMMGDLTPPPPGPNPPPPHKAMSLRVKRMGDNLTLTSVPGEPEMVSFTTAGAMTGMKATRKHRTSRKPKTAPPPPPAKQ